VNTVRTFYSLSISVRCNALRALHRTSNLIGCKAVRASNFVVCYALRSLHRISNYIWFNALRSLYRIYLIILGVMRQENLTILGVMR